MRMKKIEIRLGRGHKVIERLTRELNKRVSELQQAVAPMLVMAPEEAADRLERRRAEVASLREQISQLRAALLTVRLAVAQKNSEVGIHVLLARHAVQGAHVAALDNLCGVINNDSALSLSSVYGAFQRQKEGYSHQAVRVAVLEDNEVKKTGLALDASRAHLDSLGDEINDLNTSTKLIVEIEESIAALVGL
jgi:hypothetical protein